MNFNNHMPASLSLVAFCTFVIHHHWVRFFLGYLCATSGLTSAHLLKIVGGYQNRLAVLWREICISAMKHHMCSVSALWESSHLGCWTIWECSWNAENKTSHPVIFFIDDSQMEVIIHLCWGALSIWIWPCPAGPDDSLPCREGESLPDSPHEWPWSRKWWSRSSWFGRSLRWTSRPESGR